MLGAAAERPRKDGAKLANAGVPVAVKHSATLYRSTRGAPPMATKRAPPLDLARRFRSARIGAAGHFLGSFDGCGGVKARLLRRWILLW